MWWAMAKLPTNILSESPSISQIRHTISSYVSRKDHGWGGGAGIGVAGEVGGMCCRVSGDPGGDSNRGEIGWKLGGAETTTTSRTTTTKNKQQKAITTK